MRWLICNQQQKKVQRNNWWLTSILYKYAWMLLRKILQTLPSGNFSDWSKGTRYENDVCVYSRTTKLSCYNAGKKYWKGEQCAAVLLFELRSTGCHTTDTDSLTVFPTYCLTVCLYISSFFNFPAMRYTVYCTHRGMQKSYSPSALLEVEFLDEI
jgi:hypothetical protein